SVSVGPATRSWPRRDLMPSFSRTGDGGVPAGRSPGGHTPAVLLRDLDRVGLRDLRAGVPEYPDLHLELPPRLRRAADHAGLLVDREARRERPARQEDLHLAGARHRELPGVRPADLAAPRPGRRREREQRLDVEAGAQGVLR